MSKIEVNLISSQCGSTLTIGQSGDTVTLACGATQTGFGRTGTVDWDTTAKTASFTAVSGNGYFVNTTGGAITVTLPASPSAGDIVAVSDYASTSNTNNITIGRNSSNIEGSASDIAISNNGVALTFVYVDATRGWKVVDAGQLTDKEPSLEFVVATGGTITCCGDYKIHTFTGPGTFTVCSIGTTPACNVVDYLVTAGGGGGGSNRAFGSTAAGAGGAGGYRESGGTASGCYSVSPLGACVAALPVTAQAYPITVGGGGSGGAGPVCSTTKGTSGSNSTFSTIISAGGGGGSAGSTSSPRPGSGPGDAGGSGGGGSGGLAAGSGNTPPVSPSQGNNGGAGSNCGGGGGGGGATVAGSANSGNSGGNGGNGATSSINASPVTRAGGGGGANSTAGTAPSGGTGGGGDGAEFNSPSSGQAGTTNTGGGGGGGSQEDDASGGAGGSGIVIIRYKFQ